MVKNWDLQNEFDVKSLENAKKIEIMSKLKVELGDAKSNLE